MPALARARVHTILLYGSEAKASDLALVHEVHKEPSVGRSPRWSGAGESSGRLSLGMSAAVAVRINKFRFMRLGPTAVA